MEERFYEPEDPARMAAVLTHDLPLGFITEARWIADQLRARRREPRVFYVRNGIDKAVFTPVPAPPAPAADRPLRILVEGSPAVALKGVGDALAATHAMNEPRTVTLVSSDPDAARGVGGRPRRGPADSRRDGPRVRRRATSCSSSRASRACSVRRSRASIAARRAW